MSVNLFFSNSCLTDLSAGLQSAAELRGKFEFAGVVCCRQFKVGFIQYGALLPCIFVMQNSAPSTIVDCLDEKRYFLFAVPPLHSLSFYSVRNMAFHYCDSSQMAVAEPHRWSYLRRTPHQRHTDGSVHLPCFKPGGRH